MGLDLTMPDWDPLSRGEIRVVLRHFGDAAASRGIDPATADILWVSPRPMFAAALIGDARSAVFLKRHNPRVRDRVGLAEEHAFAMHMRDNGAQIPEVLRDVRGDTVLETRRALYELHDAIEAEDLYRNAISWSPYRCPSHAYAAGAALARFHLAARDFAAPARRRSVLQDSVALEGASAPRAALEKIIDERGALATALSLRPFEEDFERYLADALAVCATALSRTPSQWTHGDWHPSNLAWSSSSDDATVQGVFDLGLANRTTAIHDLALAIERSNIDWLDLHGAGKISVDLPSLDALVMGYQEIRPLEPDERLALPVVLPVCHVEYALSELEYFSDVVRNERHADLAYSYLIEHAKWFQSRDGEAVATRLGGLL